MPALAQKVTVDLKQKKLFIDGVEFPWYISEDGVDITGMAANNELPMVSFTILAADVEVIPEG